MTTHQAFQAHLTSWKHAVAGYHHDPLPVEVVAETLEQFNEWAKTLAQVKIQANKHGFLCEFNKGGSPRKAAWIKSGPYTLKVVFTAGAKRVQSVTETSREAYHTIDFTTQRGKIADAIFSYSKLGADVTRKELQLWQHLDSNQVCGRVKELLEMSEEKPFSFGDKKYRLDIVCSRLSKCSGSSDKANEALKWVEVQSDVKPVSATLFG